MAQSRKVLAVASAGGHWTQMMRLKTAFAGCDLAFVSTRPQGRATEGARFYCVPDANKSEKLAMIKMTLSMIAVVLKEWPDVVISTGAAPGYMAIRIARLLGARTIWLDSMANVERLSLSGRLSQTHVDLCLTQWPHLARPNGPHFAGTVV